MNLIGNGTLALLRHPDQLAAAGGPGTRRQRRRGAPPLRQPGPVLPTRRARRLRARRRGRHRWHLPLHVPRGGEPRSRALRVERRAARPAPPRGAPPHLLRWRHPPLPGRGARPRRGAGRRPDTGPPLPAASRSATRRRAGTGGSCCAAWTSCRSPSRGAGAGRASGTAQRAASAGRVEAVQVDAVASRVALHRLDAGPELRRPAAAEQNSASTPSARASWTAAASSSPSVASSPCSRSRSAAASMPSSDVAASAGARPIAVALRNSLCA